MIKYTATLETQHGDLIERVSVITPELPHYGYDGALGYTKASEKAFRQALIKAKRKLFLTMKGKTEKTQTGITHVMGSYILHIDIV